jgi:hypothetical protein
VADIEVATHGVHGSIVKAVTLVGDVHLQGPLRGG